MADKTKFSIVGALLILGVVSLTGCGQSASGGDQAARQTRRSMSMLASYYGDYLNTHGAPPKDEAAFRASLEERSAEIKRSNIGTIDDLLKSPRDGQPLVVVYGKKIVPADSPTTPWAAYEQTGVDGKHMAAQVRGSMEELTDEEIAKQFSGTTKK